MKIGRMTLAKVAARLSVCLVLLSAGGCLDGSEAADDSGLVPDGGSDTDTDSDSDTDGDSDTDMDTDNDNIYEWALDLPECDFEEAEGCYSGDYVVEDVDDLDALALFPCVSGTLLVTGDEIEALELPALSHACHIEVLGAASLQSAGFPVLDHVDGEIGLAYVPALLVADFPVLGELGGTLWINDADGLTNLDGFPSLIVAGGLSLNGNDSLVSAEVPAVESLWLHGLHVYDNMALTTLNLPAAGEVFEFWLSGNAALEEVAFPSLDYIGGEAHVSDNPTLKYLYFGELQEIASDFTVYNNSGLISLDSLASLSEVGGDLTIWRNATLESVDLTSLEHVGGSLSVQECAALGTIGDLTALAAVDGDVFIAQNDVLSDVGEYPSLAYLGGALEIYFQPNIVGLGGFSELAVLGGFVGVHDNPDLADISGLQGIVSYGGISANVYSNASLPTCAAEAFVDQLAATGWDGWVTLYGNAIDECATATLAACGDFVHEGDAVIEDAEDLGVLEGVTRIDGSLTLAGLDDVSDLSALSSLLCVSGDIVMLNTSLPDLDGLESLWYAGGTLLLNGNAELSSIAALSGLTELGGLQIFNQEALTTLSGLENLTSIGDAGAYIGRTGLTQLTGLDAVTSIGGSLDIFINCDLLSLDGLDALMDFDGYQLIIDNNAALAEGEAEELIARLVATGWTGTPYIDSATSSEECEGGTDGD